MRSKIRSSEFFRVMAFLKSRIWIYLLAVLISSLVLGFNFNMVMAFIKKDVLDAALAGEQALLVRAIALAAVTFILGTPALIWARYALASTGKRTMTGIRVKFFEHLTHLPVSSFGLQHSGDFISRSSNDLGLMEFTYTRMVPTLFFGFVLGSVGIVSILIFEWRLGLLALALGLLTTFISMKMAKPLREKSEAMQKSLGQMTERLTDIIQGLPVAKMFHIEKTTHRLYARANADLAQASVEHAGIHALYTASEYVLEWFRSIGTLVFGLFLITRGYTGLGAVVAAMHLQGNASFLFSNWGNFVTAIQRYMVGAGRVFEILDRPAEPERYATAILPAETTAAENMITIRDLHFSYNGEASSNGSEPTLKGLSLSVPEGHVVALVGPSGGGKSTLIRLLLGLYPVQQGEIRIQGKDLNQHPLFQLRDRMAYVPQDAYLFDGSIAENIRYGRPQATREEIVAAATAANAHDFILEQTNGYETLVGERGAHLSGGQRQRIAIARALLKDAPILLLDEATSALDSESEQLVQQALEVLMAGRTTIAIAHRLATIQHADRIYVLDQGCIVEHGDHATLIAQNGLYRHLYEL